MPGAPGMGGPPSIPPIGGGGMGGGMGMGGAPSKMQPVSALPGGQQRTDALFNGIMVGMRYFEQVRDRFIMLMQQGGAQLPGLTPSQHTLMTGQPLQALHERFLKLQQGVEAVQANGRQPDPAFTQEAEAYYTDLK